MRFGMISVDDAADAILAHSRKLEGRRLGKGKRLVQSDIEALRAAGVSEIMAVVLEPGDIHEDEAATRLTRALRISGIEARPAFAGRVNLFAVRAGVLQVDPSVIDAINAVDESLTLATIDNWSVVEPGQMVATVKVIPFSTSTQVLEQAVAAAGGGSRGSVLEVHAFRGLDVTLVQTVLPELADKVLDKTRRTTQERIEATGGRLIDERRCAHEIDALAATIAETSGDLLVIAGASAITDRRDVLPAGIEAAGGRVCHFGMPVDPGNLLLLAEIGDRPVLGLPGCARSPKLNGFDWVLRRVAAGIAVTSHDVMGMGVGGLLTEIPTRPQPRAARVPPKSTRLAAIVLAAGQSRRMGSRNKLLIEVDGVPMLRHAVDAAIGARFDPVIVVTGHDQVLIEHLLTALPVTIVHNPDYAAGLSTSLKAGLAALPANIDGVLVALGDMPRVNATLVQRLAAAFDPVEGRSIIVPTFNGKRGNPVLWAGDMIPAMQGVEGDAGAKHLIGQFEEAVHEVEMNDAAVLLDIDTPQALAALAGETS
ncbi:MAG: NTP transferase domain-containing protein [Geminicoccaceae bacterium]|nr:NTP transferase domain-containing protein [Geminicoccaceae bacterium]